MRFRDLLPLAMTVLLVACNGEDNTGNREVYHNVFAVHPEGTGAESVTTLPGTVEEGRTISVGFKTGGQIERIFVKEGAHVAKGQLIAELDSKDYALGVATLKEKYASLKSETERQTKLHASGNMSDNDYEKAVSGLKQLELQLSIEENRLSYCKLYSPDAGIVTKVNFENSEMVDAGTPVVELMDNSSMEVVVDLPLRLYARRDNFVSFIGETSLEPEKEIKLTLLSLTPRADNTQLYRLRLALPSGTGFTPGMNIKVKIACSGSGNQCVEVPLSSIFERDGRCYVWTVNEADSVITPTPVTIAAGTSEHGTVTVESGLNVDDVIVRAGVRHLVDGEKVNIIPEASRTNPGDML